MIILFDFKIKYFNFHILFLTNNLSQFSNLFLSKIKFTLKLNFLSPNFYFLIEILKKLK